LDTTDSLLLVSTVTGTLTGQVVIPASATPGQHYITAIGRHTGDAAQTHFTVTAPWTELGFGAARRSLNPYENVFSPSTVSTLGQNWEVFINGFGDAPAVIGGKAIFGTGAGLKAISTTTGAVLWTALPTSISYASPVVSKNIVYIGEGGTGNFYALSLSTGKTIWTTAIGGPFTGVPNRRRQHRLFRLRRQQGLRAQCHHRCDHLDVHDRRFYRLLACVR
jgi:outer membrane protein assembly factor BamB